MSGTYNNKRNINNKWLLAIILMNGEFMKKILSGLIAIGITSFAHAQTQPPCNSLKECLILKKEVASKIWNLEYPLGSLIRDSNRFPIETSYYWAEKACKELNQRLPTIKEVVSIMIPLGVSDEYVEGYLKVSPENEPAFYVNTDTSITFGRQANDGKGDEWIWSSSVDSLKPKSHFIFGPTLGSGVNVVGEDLDYRKYNVRCMKP
jgi:hypothetical protein